MDARLRHYVPTTVALLAIAAYAGFGPLPAPLAGADRLALSLVVVAGSTLMTLLAILSTQSAQREALWQALREIPSGEDFPPSCPPDPGHALVSRLTTTRSELSTVRAALTDAARRVEVKDAEIAATREKYELAVRGASDGQWEWDARTDCFSVSERWNRMLSYAAADANLRRDEWLARIHDGDRARVDGLITAHLEGTTPRFDSEHRLICHDGGIRWVLSRGTAIRHASGKTWRLVGLDSDITKSKRIEEVLRHVAEGVSGATGRVFFRRLVEHLAIILGVREVFIAECIDVPPTRVRTLACWDDGQFVSDEYDLAPTPCRQVVEKGATCFIPKGLTVQFPGELPYGFNSYLGIPIFDSHGKVLGHLVFKDVKEMDESILMDSIYRIFTARAGAEMQRLTEQKSLLEMARGLVQPTSEERLQALIRHFATYVGAKEAFLTLPIDDPVNRVRALVCWNAGALATNIEYALAGNPCEIVYGTGERLYCSDDVAIRWPIEGPLGRQSYLGLPLLDVSGAVIGHLACFDDQPMPEEMPDASALELFATRAAEEVQRLVRSGRSQLDPVP